MTRPSQTSLSALFAIGAAMAGIGFLFVSVFLLGRFNPNVGPVGVFALMGFFALTIAVTSGAVFGATLAMLEASRFKSRHPRSWAFGFGVAQMLAGAALYSGAPDLGEPLVLRAAVVFASCAVVAALGYRRLVFVPGNAIA